MVGEVIIITIITVITYGCRAFYHAGPTVWNSLPDELRNLDSFDSFKRFLKTILFSRYYSVTSALEVY